MPHSPVFGTLVGLALVAGTALAEPARVELIRLPEGGLQPEAALGDHGALHLLYFKGDPAGGDLFYLRRAPGAVEFSPPVQVNSQPASAIAVGTIRGGHLALGRRVHVAWMSAQQGGGMFYTRADLQGTEFEPQRNLTRTAYGLDGGGSVAADQAGNVYVAWHAGKEGEETRRVWVAHSADDGQEFSPEARANPVETGACGCCGMRAGADPAGNLYLFYRAATGGIHRDMHLLFSQDQGRTFRDLPVHPWELRACPMSSASLAPAKGQEVAAWETDGQVYWTRVDPGRGTLSALAPAPGEAKGRKHPAVAANQQGEVLLVWDEGTGWQQGGSLAWQLYDAQGQPSSEKGYVPQAIPLWGHAAAIAYPDGHFAIIY